MLQVANVRIQGLCNTCVRGLRGVGGWGGRGGGECKHRVPKVLVKCGNESSSTLESQSHLSVFCILSESVGTCRGEGVLEVTWKSVTIKKKSQNYSQKHRMRESLAASYGVFDCDFGFDSQEWGCSYDESAEPMC